MSRIRLEKRGQQSALRIVVTSVIFALLALVFCGFIIAAVGFNPIEVYQKMLSKVFLTSRGLRKALESSLPLMFCGLGVALTFRMNLNNIGAEGQYAIGVLCGGAYVLYGPQLPLVPGLIVLALCCFAGGAFWASLSAIPKALWNVNESITSLMLNYIALILMSYLCLGPWKAKGQNVGQTEKIPEYLQLPEIGDTKISVGIILAVFVAVLIYLAYKYTTDGYQFSVIRYSQSAARYAGMNIKRNIILIMLLSGGLAGLAGFVQYAGVSHRIIEGMPNNAGYTGIVIAYLSRLNPLVVIIVSILFAGLQNSSATVQVMGVPTQIATMIQGAVMIFVIAGDFFQRYKVVIRKEEKA